MYFSAQFVLMTKNKNVQASRQIKNSSSFSTIKNCAKGQRVLLRVATFLPDIKNLYPLINSDVPFWNRH